MTPQKKDVGYGISEINDISIFMYSNGYPFWYCGMFSMCVRVFVALGWRGRGVRASTAGERAGANIFLWPVPPNPT